MESSAVGARRSDAASRVRKSKSASAGVSRRPDCARPADGPAPPRAWAGARSGASVNARACLIAPISASSVTGFVRQICAPAAIRSACSASLSASATAGTTAVLRAVRSRRSTRTPPPPGHRTSATATSNRWCPSHRLCRDRVGGGGDDPAFAPQRADEAANVGGVGLDEQHPDLTTLGLIGSHLMGRLA